MKQWINTEFLLNIKSEPEKSHKLITVRTSPQTHPIPILTFHLLLMLMVEINKLFWQDSFIHLTDYENLLIGIRCCTWQNINFSLPFSLSFSWSPFSFLYSPSFILKKIRNFFFIFFIKNNKKNQQIKSEGWTNIKRRKDRNLNLMMDLRIYCKHLKRDEKKIGNNAESCKVCASEWVTRMLWILFVVGSKKH